MCVCFLFFGFFSSGVQSEHYCSFEVLFEDFFLCFFFFLQQLPPAKRARTSPGESRKRQELEYRECPGLWCEIEDKPTSRRKSLRICRPPISLPDTTAHASTEPEWVALVSFYPPPVCSIVLRRRFFFLQRHARVAMSVLREYLHRPPLFCGAWGGGRR